MFKKAILKNKVILAGGRRVVTNARQAASHVRESNNNVQSDFSTAAVAPSLVKTDASYKSDSVQDAIRILTAANNDGDTLNDGIMTEKLHDFEKLIIEAKLSINDCVNCGDEEDFLDDDKETAKDAVREAIEVFSDINYEFQKSFKDEEKDEEHAEILKQMTFQLDELKTELDSVLGETKRGNLLLGLDNITKRIMYWRS